jgi:hypothetical protein
VTLEEKQKLKALFVATSMYYGQEIPDPALKLYVADLEDLEFADVERALSELRRDPRATRCPLPAVIRARLNPEQDPDLRATYIANEIVEAIGRVGPYNSPGLSEEAMEVVRLEGGWQRVCQLVTNDNLSVFKAQWRQLAKAVRAEKGQRQDLLVEARRGGDLTSMSSLLPAVTGKVES